MTYTITKSATALKIMPAVSLKVRIEIEFGFRLAEIYTHHVASASNEIETFTMFQMVDETATDADVDMIRQILLRHDRT